MSNLESYFTLAKNDRSKTCVPSFTTPIIYGLLCFPSLSKESKNTPNPTHLSELPNTGPL